MTKLFTGPTPGEPASLVPLAAFRTLWGHLSMLATTRWANTRRLLQSALLAASLSALLPSAAQARTYEVVSADVPFKFHVGNRTFRPGHYQFVFGGPGLVALRDARAHVIASLITRSIETTGPSPTTKLVFDTQKKPARLTQIWLENRVQVLEILGEELAVRQSSPPSPLPPLWPDIYSLMERRPLPGFKQ